jgi:Helix-turn-helix domain
MRIAENDKIRLFDRVYDSDSGRKRHLGNNGSIVRLDGIDGRGLTVTSEATGVSGLFAFEKIRDNGRLRMGQHYPRKQRLNSRKRLLVLPSGSQSVDLTRTYTGLTRHRAGVQGFHNSRSGRCFPSYEAIADRAGCARSTVAEALKVLEWAGVLTWQNRITRAAVRQRDLFGRWARDQREPANWWLTE